MEVLAKILFFVDKYFSYKITLFNWWISARNYILLFCPRCSDNELGLQANTFVNTHRHTHKKMKYENNVNVNFSLPREPLIVKILMLALFKFMIYN